MLTHNLNMETEVIFGWMGLLACVSSVLLYKSNRIFPHKLKNLNLVSLYSHGKLFVVDIMTSANKLVTATL